MLNQPIAFIVSIASLLNLSHPVFGGSGDLYLAGKRDIGVVLCHGGGAHPDWKVVGYLRRALNTGELSAHTISLQMPIAKGKWTNYLGTFPDAVSRIRKGISRLKKSGVDRVVLIGHSMGSRMASYFLANEKNHGVSGFIGLGMRNNGGEGLNVVTNMRKIGIPMLDIYGSGGNGRDYRYGRERNALNIRGNSQVVLKGANHKFEGYEKQLETEIIRWLKTTIANGAGASSAISSDKSRRVVSPHPKHQ